MYKKSDIIVPVSDSNITFSNQQNFFTNVDKFCSRFWITIEDFYRYQIKINELKTQNKFIQHFVFSDFDGTLCSRNPQLELDIFAKTRWSEWNKIVDSMWLTNYIKKFYSEIKKDLVVREISDKTNMILTAGSIDLQEAKIQAVDLSYLDTNIVTKHSLKPKAMLDYFLYTIEKIPLSFEFYDDRVTELLPELQLLSDFFQNTIVAHNIELSPDFINKVESSTTSTFVNGQNFTWNNNESFLIAA